MNCWKTLVLIQIIIQIFIIPLKICFNQHFSFQLEPFNMTNLMLDSLPALIFLLDILVNFKSIFYEEGVLVNN